MRVEALQHTPLICPRCRAADASGELHLATLSPAPDAMTADGDLDAGLLVCDNAACARAFPVHDGVPLVLPHVDDYLEREATQLLDLPPDVARRLLEQCDDASALGRLHEHLSIYLDAHWGEATTPPADSLVGDAAAAQWRKLAALPRVAHAVELGCSGGRGALELAAHADHVVALDLHFAAARFAARRARGQAQTYLRRRVGRHYLPVTLPAATPRANVLFLVADALDPPLVPGVYARVVALNVLDSVRAPQKLLSVLDGLCATDGELVLSAPYAWSSAVVDDAERFPSDDPAAWLRHKLQSGDGLRSAYSIVDEDELPWHLRRDARSTTSYRTHYLRARRR